jgi:hypothetical protein
VTEPGSADIGRQMIQYVHLLLDPFRAHGQDGERPRRGRGARGGDGGAAGT